MAKIVRFPADFYDTGVVKFAAEKYYPLNSETQSLVTAGYAEIIDSDDAVNLVEVLQAIADMARQRADAAMAHANELAGEAELAQSMASEARGPSAGKSVKATVPADVAALREAAATLQEQLSIAALEFDALKAAALEHPEDAELATKVKLADEAGFELNARYRLATQAAEAAEAALQG